MEDLGLVAELFKTSSTLERAAASLEKMSSGQEEIEHSQKEALLWAGQFLNAMDWSAKQQDSVQVIGGLALQATSVRPTFYSCLFRIAPQLREAGLQNEKDLTAFLNSLYLNLLCAGAPGRGHKKLTPDQSKLGALLLHEMAESILVQINNNGLPRPTTTLKDEWKPTANELTTVLAI
jgi:hypothetical protein